jgi:hypothetical protein
LKSEIKKNWFYKERDFPSSFMMKMRVAIMILIAGAVIGACVCLFGIWAFLKGQSSMLDIVRGAKPTLFNLPAAFSRGGTQGDLSGQVREMFKEPQIKRGE